MCLVLLAWQAHPDFPLVVAANRDEFHQRPTAQADFWADAPAVLAGRDLSAGGTWMGMTRSGRFAALTNFRDPGKHRDDAPSRGKLVSGFLESTEAPLSWLQGLAGTGVRYNGFNLLVGDGRTLACYSNVSGEIESLRPGVYGLSNELLDSPWPKVSAAKSALSLALAALPEDGPLLELLRDDRTYPDEQLPRTGVDIALERMLSAAFIRNPRYGTRSSTVLLVQRDGVVNFDEQSWALDGSAGGRQRFRFSLCAP